MPSALRNPAGRGGPVAALARRHLPPALARAKGVLNSTSASPRDRLAAARLLMADPTHRAVALDVLGRLVADPRTPDAAAIDAAGLIAEATTAPKWVRRL
jgi:hypothetical protein